MAGKLTLAAKRQIIGQICEQHKADDLQPHEVIVSMTGEVWIDRRGRDSRNVPFVVANWS